MSSIEWRAKFADFLTRLSANADREGEWSELVVNHYHDEKLESIRRDLVRLAIERDPAGRPAW